LWERVGSILGEMAKPRTIAELERGMTPKQIKLARALAEGGISKVEAYRQVYEWNQNANPNSVQVAATRAAGNAKVALLSTAIREQGTARVWENKTRFQNWLMAGITSTIDNTESDITRLRALELAGRTRYASLFEEPSANETTAQFHGAIVDAIRVKLNALICGSLTPADAGLDALTLEAVAEAPTGVGEGDEGE
jgi:DNA-binding FadR family transcriptional regulator